MAATLTDVASKHAVLKERHMEQIALGKDVDSALRRWSPEDAPPAKGCFSWLRCPGMMPFKGRTAVSTKEIAIVNDESVLQQSGQSSQLLRRMVGIKKQNNEQVQIEVALKTVEERVQALTDRVKLGRERAMLAKKNGKNEEAVRELRKTKAVEKQLGVARAAADALEQQQSMIEESNLQRELTAALKSTTAGLKTKSKGLLSMAEKAIDASVEVRDDVEDVAAVFEQIVPTYDGADDDELLSELEAMVDDGGGPPPAEAAVADFEPVKTVEIGRYPAAPTAAVVHARAEREALLAS